MCRVFLIFIFSSSILSIASAMNMTMAMSMLEKYGYMNKSMAQDEKMVTEAMKKFQMVAHIPITGRLDQETEDMMSKPRCGMPDDHMGFAPYVLTGRKWNKNRLTYRVLQYTEKLTRHQVDRELVKAFSSWSRYTPLTFSRRGSGPVDLQIRFSHGYNRDRFDGRGGTLAVAYFPTNGQIYFDESEAWVDSFRGGTNLYLVAVHEIGHALGLDHSMTQNAIMYPYYSTNNLHLTNDDIEGMRRIYGRRQYG